MDEWKRMRTGGGDGKKAEISKFEEARHWPLHVTHWKSLRVSVKDAPKFQTLFLTIRMSGCVRKVPWTTCQRGSFFCSRFVPRRAISSLRTYPGRPHPGTSVLDASFKPTSRRMFSQTQLILSKLSINRLGYFHHASFNSIGSRRSRGFAMSWTRDPEAWGRGRTSCQISLQTKRGNKAKCKFPF
jgi:hypothetical protein